MSPRMASNEEEDRRRAEKARQVWLFRYALIQDLLDPALTTANAAVWHGSWPPGNTLIRSASKYGFRGARSTGGPALARLPRPVGVCPYPAWRPDRAGLGLAAADLGQITQAVKRKLKMLQYRPPRH
ncbi:hypothetical protein [Streptomyces sp. NPDC005077]|uniref:hypothetical protein n=1 Tax=unclassified Streptomyces TaxID=2593676 RepID=UPI0033A8B067